MFENIVGNDQVRNELENIINTKKIANSYLFSGVEGIGKVMFARDFAKNIMCLNGGNCNQTCESCKKFESKSNPNYIEINIGEYKKDIITIDQIRDEILNNVNEKPIISNKKVYVINNADKMTEQAQNALLKTLEEPPKFVSIILIASNENLILPTIKSRCVKIQFNKLSNDEIEKIVGKISKEEIEILNGSLKDYKQMNQMLEQYKQVKKLIENIKKDELINVLNDSDVLYKNKDYIINLLEYMNICLYNEKQIDSVNIIENTKRKILANNNYEMTIDNLLIKLWKDINRKV